jgi:uncharacterized surface protein with fasciclin (FAS1) repeats
MHQGLPKTAATSATRKQETAPRLIASVAEQAGFHTFAAAVRSTPHIRALEGKGPFTVFAPTDAAFEKFSRSQLDRLLDGDQELRELVIGYHIASGKVVTSQLRGKRIRAVMHAGGDVIIDGRSEKLGVNGAQIVQGDIAAANGVIHGVDTVLWPRKPLKGVGI